MFILPQNDTPPEFNNSAMKMDGLEGQIYFPFMGGNSNFSRANTEHSGGGAVDSNPSPGPQDSPRG